MVKEGGDPKKERGRRIRSLRESRGLTLQELAARLGIKYQSLREWETGRTSPSVDNIGRLSDIFGVHPTWIWTGKGSKYIKAKRKDEANRVEEESPEARRLNRAIGEFVRYLRTRSPEEVKLIHEIAIKILEADRGARKK
ncbi:MAG TPA: XRE family transcriptional regulator [Deltaproteobacteria bacterium]|nr:XRE family transcriptional regulator [Deltaproteobacteria bacterium]